jgi:hypothetical protein
MGVLQHVKPGKSTTSPPPQMQQVAKFCGITKIISEGFDSTTLYEFQWNPFLYQPANEQQIENLLLI